MIWYAKEKPKIKKEFGHQSILRGAWIDDIVLDSNGFAWGLSINRDAGGSLYFNKEDFSCKEFLFNDLKNAYIKFSEEKAKHFAVENRAEGAVVHTYAHHNIDHYPGALFLRNWAILYINSAMEHIVRQNLESIFGKQI